MRMVRGAHPPQTVNSVHEREGGCNTTRYSCPPQPYPGHAGATSSPHGAAPTPLPTGTGVLRRAQPATSDGASRHHSTSRTTLTILATTPGTVTQTRHPNDPQRTTREGARQTDRHEHEHSTTELEQRPGAPMGSTGTHRGGPAGPCHRRGCTYEWHKRNWKYGYGAPRNTGKWIMHATLPRRGREQGTNRGKIFFTAVRPLVMAFLPRGGRAAHSTNVPCRPHTPGTGQHRNKRHTCPQQIRLCERPLRPQGTNAEQTNQEAANTTTHRQNHYSGRNVTVNGPRAHRLAPSWPGVHGPVRERRPTS